MEPLQHSARPEAPRAQQPSIYGELQLLHEYADRERFSDLVLREKQCHYLLMQQDPDLSIRAQGDVTAILDFLSFEITMREMGR